MEGRSRYIQLINIVARIIAYSLGGVPHDVESIMHHPKTLLLVIKAPTLEPQRPKFSIP